MDIENINSNINRNTGLGRTSLFIGLICLIAWVIPLIGIPLSIIGLILGLVSLNSSRRDLARAGISLGAIGLFISIAYTILGFYLITSGFLSDIIQLP